MFYRKLLFTMALLTALFVLCVPALADSGVAKTNMGGVIIAPINEGGFVQYADSSQEAINENYIGLFVNGSIIKGSNLFIESDRAMLPLRLVSESLGAAVKWEPATQGITVTDGETAIELQIGNTGATVNGVTQILDAAPRIVGGSAYIPARFIAEALGASIEYYDGKSDDSTRIVPRIRQVMISRYPAGTEVYSARKAVETVREQLIIAYELRFGEFVPAEVKVSGSDGIRELYNTEGDMGLLRNVITFLEESAENDRYYVIPVVFDFWFDKYTGDVYVFYNGQGMTIWEFDPLHEGALAFAG